MSETGAIPISVRSPGKRPTALPHAPVLRAGCGDVHRGAFYRIAMATNPCQIEVRTREIRRGGLTTRAG